MKSSRLHSLRAPHHLSRSLRTPGPWLCTRQSTYRGRPVYPHSASATPPADDTDANSPARPEGESALKEEAASPPSKFKLWLACIKPPMYTVAITPMVLAAVLAYFVTGVFNGAACSNLTLGGILVIAWLNLRCVIHQSVRPCAACA